jgi:hypothetical protein
VQLEAREALVLEELVRMVGLQLHQPRQMAACKFGKADHMPGILTYQQVRLNFLEELVEDLVGDLARQVGVALVLGLVLFIFMPQRF